MPLILQTQIISIPWKSIPHSIPVQSHWVIQNPIYRRLKKMPMSKTTPLHEKTPKKQTQRNIAQRPACLPAWPGRRPSPCWSYGPCLDAPGIDLAAEWFRLFWRGIYRGFSKDYPPWISWGFLMIYPQMVNENHQSASCQLKSFILNFILHQKSLVSWGTHLASKTRCLR